MFAHRVHEPEKLETVGIYSSVVIRGAAALATAGVVGDHHGVSSVSGYS